MKLLGIIIVVVIIIMDFDITNQLLTGYSAFVRYWKQNMNIMGLYINYLHVLRRPMT